MNKRELERRTRQFAVEVIREVVRWPSGPVRNVIGHQLLKSSTSIGANYREANRASSPKDFLHKLNVVEKEASETYYWLELIRETGAIDPTTLQRLLQECNELLAIFTAAGKTCKRKLQKKDPKSTR